MGTFQKLYDTLVIGGGITGLATAYFLQKKGADVLLLEKTARTGGWIRTERKEDFLIEYGPRALRPTPLTLALVEELGLQEEVVWAQPKAHKRYIYQETGLVKVTPFLLLKALLPLTKEFFMKPQDLPEETIASFARRHFGAWLTDNVIDPVTLGIYGGDMHHLSLDRCFPLLKQWEKEKGSVIRGFLSHARSSKAALFSFKEGMQTLPDRLRTLLGDKIRLNSCVKSCLQKEGIWHVETIQESFLAKNVIRTDPVDGEYLSLSVVTLGFKNRCLPLEGFGFLVPSHFGLALKGCLFDSCLQNGERTQLSFMMKALHEEEALKTALEAASQILGITEKPLLVDYFLAEKSIFQYRLNLFDAPPVGINACLLRAAQFRDAHVV